MVSVGGVGVLLNYDDLIMNNFPVTKLFVKDREQRLITYVYIYTHTHVCIYMYGYITLRNNPALKM